MGFNAADVPDDDSDPFLLGIAKAERDRADDLARILDDLPPQLLPQTVPPPARYDAGFDESLRIVGENARRKDERAESVAQATLATQELIAALLEAAAGQSRSIETLANETVALGKWTKAIVALTALGIIIGVVALFHPF